LLTDVGLWFVPQHPVGIHHLDFLVVTPLGTRYDVEVDGRGHLTDEAVRADAIRDRAISATDRRLRILRVDARRIFSNEDEIRKVLQHLA